MADVNQANEGYRSFVRGGIAAVIAINTLALGAVLTQISDLREIADAAGLERAFRGWIAGVTFGVLTWLAAALAAQAYAHGLRVRETWAAAAGYVTFLVSLGSFVYGAWSMSGAVLH